MIKKIAIIGAGISGLTFANFLKKNSRYDFTIYEKKSSLNLNEGYGVQLSANSVSILNEVGFKDLKADNKFNPKKVYGSFAGAIGLGQFMPSNYKAYGVDFDRNGRVQMQTAIDAIASIAKYLKKNRWKRSEDVAIRVSYQGNRFKQYKTGYNRLYYQNQLENIYPKGEWKYKKRVRLIKLNRVKYDELWFGAKNFFVITRYNHSAYYAMTIHQLATLLSSKLKESI